MKSSSPVELYLEFRDLARHTAHRLGLARYTNEAESYLAMLVMDDPQQPPCHSFTRRDEKKCRLGTWIVKQITWHLLTLKMRDAKEWRRSQGRKVHNSYEQRDLITELSNEAAIIIRMIRNDPDGCRAKFNRANAQEKLKWFMAEQGWPDGVINRVFEELKEIIR